MARRGENIRKRADGRWEARAIVGYRLTGEPVYKSVYAKTYGEVREKKKRLPNQEETKDLPVSLKKITFGQLMEDWLKYTRGHVKESTYVKYHQMNQVHIAPCLGERRLTALTSRDLENYAEEKLQRGRRNGTGGLSAKTVTDLLVVIRQALTYGERHGYPCPKGLEIHYPRQITPQIQILSYREQEVLEQKISEQVSCDEDFIYAGILLSLYAGLRIGEVCALRWEDVQLDRGTVTIQRTLMRIQSVDGSPEQGTRTKLLENMPKSSHSFRTIPLPSFLTAYLTPRKKEDDCYLLTGSICCMEPRSYYRKYQKFMKSCGLDGYNYHALRHTFATRCVEKGFDMKSLSEILGHADVSVTMRRYVHPTLDMKKEQMERLANGIIQGQICGQTGEKNTADTGPV